MKNFKRKLAGLLVFAMVLGIMAPGVVARAADGAPAVEFSAINEELKVTGATDYNMEYAEYTGTSPVTASGSALSGLTEADAKKLKWEEIELDRKGEVTIDLSSVKKTKDTTFIIHFSKDGEKDSECYWVQKVAKQVTDLKVGFVATKEVAATDSKTGNKALEGKTAECVVGNNETGWLYFATGKKATSGTPVSAAAVEWKKGVNGKWEKVDSKTFGDTLAAFKAKGATLYFRLAPVDTPKTQADDTTNKVTPVWASKEVKYSYKKQAKAPSVKVDISKHTIGLKLGQEYQIYTSGKGWSEDWISTTKYHTTKDKLNKNIRVEDLAVEVATSGNAIETTVGDSIYNGVTQIRVRTAAANGKAPSKSATVKLNVVTTAAVDFNDTTASAVTVESVLPYTYASGINVKSTDTSLEFTVLVSGASIDATTKWTAFTAKKSTVKVTTVKGLDGKTIKLKDAKPEEVLVYVRQAGVKANKTTGAAQKLSGPVTSLSLSQVAPTRPQVLGSAKPKETVSGASVAYAANDGTGTTPASITLTVSTATGGAIETELKQTIEVEFDNLGLSKETTNYTLKAKGSVDKNITLSKLALNKEGKGEITITVKKGTKVNTDGYTWTVNFGDMTLEVIVKVENAK